MYYIVTKAGKPHEHLSSHKLLNKNDWPLVPTSFIFKCVEEIKHFIIDSYVSLSKCLDNDNNSNII